MRKDLSETDLLQWSECSMRRPVDYEYRPPAALLLAEEVARQLAIARFNHGVLLPAPMTRGICDTALKKVQRSLKQSIQDPGLLRLSRRLRDLFSRHAVLQPDTPYTLPLGSASITGRYMVLGEIKGSRMKRELRILRLRTFDEGKKGGFHPPDLLSWCRWLHLQNIENHTRAVRVLNYTVGKTETEWIEGPYPEHEIRSMITQAAAAVRDTKFQYPSPGSHCNSCLSRACQLETLNG